MGRCYSFVIGLIGVFFSLLLSLLLSVLLSAHAEAVLRFDSYNIEDGLSQSSITSIYQDRQGFMWFGTQEGLNRFDGYNFRMFRHVSSEAGTLSGNLVKSIYQDKVGNLWLGTFIGGLNRFDPQTERFEHFRHNRDNPDNPKNIHRSSINAIFQLNDQQLWLGTKDELTIMDLDSETFSFIALPIDQETGIGGSQISSFSQGPAGDIWIATEGGGLYRYHLDSQTFSHYIHAPTNPTSISHNLIKQVFVDADKNVWLATANGLNRFDPDTDGFVHFKHLEGDRQSLSDNTVNAIVEDRFKRLWIATNNGLNILDKSSGLFTQIVADGSGRHGLVSSAIRSLAISADHVLWAGSFAQGVSKHNIDSVKFHHVQHNRFNTQGSFSNSNIWAITESHDGDIWLGEDGGGLTHYDRQTGQFNSYRHQPGNANSLSSDQIYSILEASPGFFWLGTVGHGLNSIDIEAQQVQRYQHDDNNPASLSHDQVMVVYVDKQNNLWAGTRVGLDLFDRQKGEFIHFSHDPNDPHSLGERGVTAILEDSQGNFWVGSYGGGLNKMDRETGRFTHFRHDPDNPASLSNDALMSITESLDGGLWVASLGGLDRVDIASGKVERFIKQDVAIYVALETEKHGLWLSANKGLINLNKHTRELTYYDTADGLQADDFNFGAYAKTAQGELFFGGSNGFNHFYPQQVTRHLTTLAVTLTQMRVSNNPVPIRLSDESSGSQNDYGLPRALPFVDEVVLSYQQNLISFEFSTLNYINPKHYHYQYQLAGHSDNWITTDYKSRSATYTNLPAGQYTLKVRARRHNEPWGEQITELSIRVIAPPWLSWWAYVLYVLLVVLIIGAFMRQRQQKFRQVHFSEERLSLALWGSNSEMWDWDLTDGTMYRSNYKHTANREAGFYPFDEELLRQDTHPDDVEAVIALFVRRDWVQFLDFTSRERSATGEWRWYRRRARVVSRNAQGEAQRIVGTVEDVHELKQVQDQLAELNEALEQRVIERTAELTETLEKLERLQDQLIESKKMASLLGVVAGVAHELNTPLGVVVTALTQVQHNIAQLVGKLNDKKLSRQDLNHFEHSTGMGFELLQSNVDKSISLVHKFKALSLNTDEDQPQRFSLAELISQVIEVHRSRLYQQNIDIQCDCSPAIDLVSYPKMLADVLTQLIDNSCRHGYAGIEQTQALISIKVTSNAQNMVAIHYADDGVGLDTTEHSDLFEPFYTTKRGSECTGLGMSIVYNQVVHKLMGHVSFCHEQQRGLAICLDLPVVVEIDTDAIKTGQNED